MSEGEDERHLAVLLRKACLIISISEHWLCVGYVVLVKKVGVPETMVLSGRYPTITEGDTSGRRLGIIV